MKLAHIGIETNDLYSMELFYTRYLGFTRSYDYISRNTPGLRTIFLTRGDAYLELLTREPASAAQTDRRAVYHISLESADVDAEYETLSQFPGLKVKKPRITGDGFREMELVDPDGNVIEISMRVSPPPVRPVRAVIFDLDGTLIDSEKNYYVADHRLLEHYGIPFTEEEKKKFIGGGNLDMMRSLRTIYGINDSVEELLARKNRIYLDIALGNTAIFPETFALLQTLHARGIPCAIASGSSPVIIDALLNDLDLRRYFTAVVSAEDVGRGKPQPDIFIEAARRMGRAHDETLVIEDSMFGIEAARRCQMPCIGIPYIVEDPLPDSFYLADRLYPRGMVDFTAQEALNWIDSRN